MRKIFAFVFVFLIAVPAFALTASQRLILFSGCPNGASVYLNFAANTYCGGSLGGMVSLVRASPGLAQDTSGTWYSFGNNVPRITNQGFLIEEARTNKCTNFNANPTDLTGVTKSGDAAATLTLVDDTAALVAAGLQNIATSGKVYKLDNSAGVSGSTATITGTVADTNAQSISIYERGTGGGFFQLSGGEGSTVISASAAYVRKSASNVTPGSSARQLQVVASAGTVIFFILNQLEEGAFVTSPIVVAGASATRAADVPQLIGPALTAALSAKGLFAQTNLVAGIGAGPNRLFAFDGAGLSNGNINYPTNTGVTITNGTNAAAATIGGAGTNAGVVKLAAGFDAASMTILANSGTKVTNANAWATGTTPYLGNISTGTRALNGYLQCFALSNTKGAFDGLTSP